MKRYQPDSKKPRQLTPAEARRLDAMPIDYSDILPLGDEFFAKATEAWPPPKQQLTQADRIRAASPQLIAEVMLYSEEDGGRKHPATVGWGCPCCLSKNEPVTGYDGWPLLGDKSLKAGERRRLGFVFLSGEEAAAVFRKAGKFYLWEGHFIGEAVVLNEQTFNKG